MVQVQAATRSPIPALFKACWPTSLGPSVSELKIAAISSSEGKADMHPRTDAGRCSTIMRQAIAVAFADQALANGDTSNH